MTTDHLYEMKTLYDIQVKTVIKFICIGLFTKHIVLNLLYRNKKLFGDSSDPEIEHFS